MRNRTRLVLGALTAAMMLSGTTASLAQDKQKPDTTVTAGQDEGTRNLNQQQANAAARQNAGNAASAESYDARVAAYQAGRADTAEARARYEAEMQAWRDRQAAYEAAQAQWRADVAACRAGDRSRCAPQ